MNKNLRWALKLMVWFVRFGRFVFLSRFFSLRAFHFISQFCQLSSSSRCVSLSVAYAQQPMYVHIAEYLDISFTTTFNTCLSLLPMHNVHFSTFLFSVFVDSVVLPSVAVYQLTRDLRMDFLLHCVSLISNSYSQFHFISFYFVFGRGKRERERQTHTLTRWIIIIMDKRICWPQIRSDQNERFRRNSNLKSH